MGEADEATLLGGRLCLRQLNRGHRVGTDAVLLAAATRPEPGQSVLDAGAGVGAVGLAVALRHDGAVTLLEREAELAALARDNCALNGLDRRVEVLHGDLFARSADALRFDWVVSNPPYHPPGAGRPSPDPLRARAHVLPGDEGGWLRAMLARAAPHARVVLIQRTEALPALLAAAEGRLGAISVLPIHARADDPAIRILFGGIVGSRAPFRLIQPLVLHGTDGSFTPAAEAVHRGEALLTMLPTRRSRPPGPALSQ